MMTRSPKVVLVLLSLMVLAFGLTAVQAQSPAPFRVYLTFEDGPTAAYTPEILDILAEYNAKATFFVNGWQLAGKEAIVQRIVHDGHALGNHLWQEKGFYAGAPDADVIAAYYETEAAIRTALGPELPTYEQQTRLFRQPGGGGHALMLPDGEQVISYNWHVDGDDCGFRLPATVDRDNFDQFVLDNILGEPHAPDHFYNVYEHGDGTVIVLHDINRVTARVLPVILRELGAAGATFLALPRPEDQLGTQPVVLGAPPVMGAGLPGMTMPAQVTATAYLRAKPFVGGEILNLNLEAGRAVTAVGRTAGWVQVVAGDQTGWVTADALKILGPIPSLPALQ